MAANREDILKRMLDKQIGRPVDPEPTHLGDTGLAITAETDVVIFNDNSVLPSEVQKRTNEECHDPDNPCKKTREDNETKKEQNFQNPNNLLNKKYFPTIPDPPTETEDKNKNDQE